MSSREEMLVKIRQSLGANQKTDINRSRIVARRIDSHPRGIVPERTSKPKRSSLALFCEKVVASQASVKRVKSYDRVGAAIQDCLRRHNLPQRIRMGGDKRLQNLGWDDKNRPQISYGPSDGTDLVCLSHALGGVAETGTLILTSGHDNPTSLNFLPETHIIVVRSKDIRKSYEGIWKALRRRFGKGKLSRTINMITGPSRSADIEQTLILGAHGPLRLHVIVVDEAK